jgi:hypothetical protein
MKQKKIYLFIALGLSSFHGARISCEELDPDIVALLDENFTQLDAPLPSIKEPGCFPTESILGLLTPPTIPDQGQPILNLVTILREDIYKKTTGPITTRSLLDLPALTPDYFYNNFWTLTTEPFFNYTPKVYLTKNSPFLRSFIDLNNQNVINELSDNEFIGVNVPPILGLFSTTKFRQYRAGIMFGFARSYENWTICGRIPLYYLLEHFFLTDEERDAIAKNPFFGNDESEIIANSPSDEVNKFALRHLVSDKFGTGDTRLSILAQVVNQDFQNLWLGLQATLPTAKDFNRGLIGGLFSSDAPIPNFNLQHFFNVYLCPSDFPELNKAVIRKESTALLIDVLDRLSTILINSPMGNGKHFAFGPEIDWRYCLNEYFSIHAYSSLQISIPHRETRFFLIEKQKSDFDRDWRDPQLAGENLSVLNRLIIQTFFPLGIRTTITPGMRFQLSYQLLYKSQHWDIGMGFDYWVQGHELQQPLLHEIPLDLPIIRRKAARPAAHQGKLFASAGYYGTLERSTCETDWYVCTNIDASVFNKGIGQTYTAGLRVGIEF